MDARDALRLLGLPGPASAAEVKTAYRALARELHPDAGGSVEGFREVQAAYEALRNGTSARARGPAPQRHAAAVDDRWWEAPGAWHEEPVDSGDLDLRSPVDRSGVQTGSVSLLARLILQRGDGWALVSRAPGARLNRLVRLLDPDLVASIEVTVVGDGPRAGHDVLVRLRAPGGKGRRTAAQQPLPPGWVRSVGSDVVELERRLRPSRTQADTAVRAARELEALCEALEWPLAEWSLIGPGA